MALHRTTVKNLARHLEEAELNARAVTKITDDYPDMDWKDAYDIQWEIRRRKRARGHRISGLKMGLTSWAKMSQMGVETPIYAFLADYFGLTDGAEIKVDELIHPRVEAEIAVVTAKTLRGPGCHLAEVMSAIDCVMPAVEIIDSRYRDFKFDLKSVIADNASSSRFVTGGGVKKITEVDVKTLGVALEKNGKIVEVGAGAAALGHPAASVAMLANMLAERNEEIAAGTFIMTGGITAATAVVKGDAITARYQDLGHVSMKFV